MEKGDTKNVKRLIHKKFTIEYLAIRSFTGIFDRTFPPFSTLSSASKFTQIPTCAQRVLKAYDLIHNPPDDDNITEIGNTIPIPFFSIDLLKELCDTAITFLKTTHVVLQLEAPCYVVGDLHGNIFDLIRILQLSGPPPRNRFLFLGDYVDRGQYSIEVITLLLALYIAYPRFILLIRGNHEFANINATYGFYNECMSNYGSDAVYNKFNEVFAWLPVGAIISGKILCVHGGLSPQLHCIDDFYTIERPLINYEKTYVADLVWSDPSSDITDLVHSDRGAGVKFGVDSLHAFLKTTGLSMLIRAHQCVQLGVEQFEQENLYTVFSCSNYADAHNNRCGLIFIQPNLEIKKFSLPPIVQLDRSTAIIDDEKLGSNNTNYNSKLSMAKNSKRGISMAASVSMLELSKTIEQKHQIFNLASRRKSYISATQSEATLPRLHNGPVSSLLQTK